MEIIISTQKSAIMRPTPLAERPTNPQSCRKIPPGEKASQDSSPYVTAFQ